MPVAIAVCGGRGYADREKIFATLDRVHALRVIYKLIHGNCSVVDKIAAEWARARGVQVVCVPADWKTHGRAAGPIRNKFMCTLKPNGVVAFPGGNGTADMKDQARKAGIPVMEISE